MQKQDIINVTYWAQKDFSIKDFCVIFNIPYPPSNKISKSISYLSDLLSNYSWYLQSISSNKIISKSQEHFTYLLSDIFGELAISIKLAAEGYVKYSLREIRSVLDLLYAGLYIASTWTYDSQKIEEGINPMAEAFFSGYWDKMKCFKLDDLIITGLELKDGKLLGDSEIKNIVLNDTNYFYWILMNNNKITSKACEKHLDNLLENLKNKLVGINSELTDDLKQSLSKLVFKPEFNEENISPCDYCNNKATIYGIFSKPDPPTMRKLIKHQLENVDLNNINSCIKESFKVMHKEIRKNKSYFVDIIHHEIYAKLDNYVHSNIVPEPTISEWLYDYFMPTVVTLQCILSTPIWDKYLKRN